MSAFSRAVVTQLVLSAALISSIAPATFAQGVATLLGSNKAR